LRQPVTLIFDIGKTTKKALLFDRKFNVLEEITECFEEISDDDGFPSENLPMVSAWAREIIRKTTRSNIYEVTHINFSAYGASIVAIDRQHEPLLPFYNYLKPCPDGIREKFHADYISNHALLEDTASPWLGFLNSGIQVYWHRHAHKNLFSSIKAFLHLPQFFAFLVTGQLFNEKTSLGCHTMLWNFRTNDYHHWVHNEGLLEMFPAVADTSHTVGCKLNGQPVKVGIGVHDSSAALMPYLLTQKKPFLMLSTGTWNICFNPSNNEPLTREELTKDCLCYMAFDGRPVKASRIFLGHEHEKQQKIISAHFGKANEYYKQVVFNERTYLALKKDDAKKFYPVAMEGTGPLPGRQSSKTDLSLFTDFAEAEHRLMIDLAAWQKLSIDLVDPEAKISDVIVVGGFSKSPLFLEILKREIPTRTFYLSDHPRASALGAAWLIHDPDSLKDAAVQLNIIPF
jgi:L-fuculokinase